MALQITIDQTGKSAGVAGQAREDLDLSVAVDLEVVGAVSPTSYEWVIIDKPLSADFTTISSADLTTPGASTTQVTPIDYAGTYLIEVRVDQGFGLGAREEDRTRITFYAGPTLNADPSLLPRRVPSFLEVTEHNVPDVAEPLGNTRGWAKELHKWFKVISTAGNIDGGNLGSIGTSVFSDKSNNVLNFRRLLGSRLSGSDTISIGLEVDLIDSGGVCDSGTTNNSVALEALLAGIESYTPYGANSAGLVIINLKGTRTQSFHFPTQVNITQFKNIWIRSNGCIITSDVDYVFKVSAANGVRQTHLMTDMFFDGCGIEFEDEVAGFNGLYRLQFYNTPAAAIFLPATTGIPGTDGSIIGGEIAYCLFDGCYNGVVVEGDQSDLWTLKKCQFLRGLMTDIVMWSTGWLIEENDFEQRNHTTGSALEPWIAIRGTGRCRVLRNRFGNEVVGNNKPPKYAIVVGNPNAAEDEVSYYNEILGNYAGGSGTADATSAYAFIQYNRPAINNVVDLRHGHYRQYFAGAIDLTHSNLRRGNGNTVLTHGAESTSLWVSQTKLVRGYGGWNIQGPKYFPYVGAAAIPLIDGRLDVGWSLENATLAQDVPGHNSLTDTGYTLTRTTNGNCRIYQDVPTTASGRPITFSVWLRKPSGSPVTAAVLHITYNGSTPLTDFNNTITLQSNWQRYQITVTPTAGVTLTLNVYSGPLNSSETTGDIEVSGLELVEGLAPTVGVDENFDITGKSSQKLASRLAASGTATSGSAAQVTGALTLEEGWVYKLNVHVTGTIATHGHLLTYKAEVEAARALSGSAVLLAGTLTEVGPFYYSTVDGSPAPGGEADPADVTVTIATASNTVTFSVDNADASLDLQNVRVWTSWDRKLI